MNQLHHMDGSWHFNHGWKVDLCWNKPCLCRFQQFWEVPAPGNAWGRFWYRYTTTIPTVSTLASPKIGPEFCTTDFRRSWSKVDPFRPRHAVLQRAHVAGPFIPGGHVSTRGERCLGRDGDPKVSGGTVPAPETRARFLNLSLNKK